MDGFISADRYQVSGQLDKTIAEQLILKPCLKVIQFFDFKPEDNTLRILNDVVFMQRKDITLRVYGYPEMWRDVSFLEKIPELQNFQWESDVFDSIAPLYKLKKLVSLSLGMTQPKPKISIKFLSDFRDSLENLTLSGDHKDLSSISTLTNLSLIWFCSTKLKDLEFLTGLSLQTFGNYGSRVGSFEQLRNIKSLKKIWLKTNSKIEDISFIEDLPNIENIELQYVAKITKFPKCSHLQHLRRIFAFQCNRLEDIDEVMGLDNCIVHISGNRIQNHIYQTENFNSENVIFANE